MDNRDPPPDDRLRDDRPHADHPHGNNPPLDDPPRGGYRLVQAPAAVPDARADPQILVLAEARGSSAISSDLPTPRPAGTFESSQCRSFMSGRPEYQVLLIGDLDILHLKPLDTAGQERYHSLAPMYYHGAGLLVANELFYEIAGTASASDIKPISSARDFFREFGVPASPAILIILCRYSLGVVTQAFAGHLGNLELAAVSIENSVIADFTKEVIGDCKHNCLDLVAFVHLCEAIVEVNWAKQEIADTIGKFAIWMLQRNSAGVHIKRSCGITWSGFSWMAFKNLWSFIKLSVASAIML
ncbi:hypothetical protein Sjap_003977 [Stephania japonica]|uniref:Uncharacterized protein n=1 Tax=Stephania japonica TaxID=461633 RepID=A0AAP0K2A0_9MAGN